MMMMMMTLHAVMLASVLINASVPLHQRVGGGHIIYVHVMFCVFVAGWRHALRSEWPFIIIIIM